MTAHYSPCQFRPADLWICIRPAKRQLCDSLHDQWKRRLICDPFHSTQSKRLWTVILAVPCFILRPALPLTDSHARESCGPLQSLVRSLTAADLNLSHQTQLTPVSAPTSMSDCVLVTRDWLCGQSLGETPACEATVVCSHFVSAQFFPLS